ncbi:MAG: hypothetical protein ABIA93_01770 [Candidatus Woesearchaeota archaeon]
MDSQQTSRPPFARRLFGYGIIALVLLAINAYVISQNGLKALATPFGMMSVVIIVAVALTCLYLLVRKRN